MENNPAGTDGRGPRAGAGRAPLSEPRAAILHRLEGQPEPTTLAALVAATGLHPNTVREHLSGLVRHGLVRRFKAESTGRGRPAWLYEAGEKSAMSEYAGLAAALAGALSRSGPGAVPVATEAGEAWGRELAHGRADRPTDASPRGQVLTLLDDLGFGPERSAGDASGSAAVRLTRCPLLEAAHRYPDVVCAVHLGIVRGALQTYGGDPDGSHLMPFAEPGACVLHLPHPQP